MEFGGLRDAVGLFAELTFVYVIEIVADGHLLEKNTEYLIVEVYLNAY